MTTAEQIMEDMKASMKSGDSSRTGVLRMLRGSFKNEEIKLGHVLDEAEVLKVLVREAKQRRDSILAYREAGREDLVAIEEAELTIIQTYLPQPMTETEVAEVVAHVVAELEATALAQMGVVIGEVMKRVGARAEGGLVSRLVREKLSS